MPISTEDLHERSDTAAGAGDFVSALRFAGEVLRVSPRDHRARIKAGLSFGALGDGVTAVDVLLTAADQLVAEGFVLSAIAVCRAALSFGVAEDRVRALLRRVHPMISGVVARGRARVAPPVPPFMMADDLSSGSLDALSEEALLRHVRDLALTAPPYAEPSNDTLSVPMFSDLSADAFVSLVERLGYLNIEPGQCVIEEGAPGNSLYILLQGEVEVSTEASSRRKVLARLGPGSLFGEMALITHKPRSATVTTTQASELFEVDRASVEAVAEAYPTIVDELVEFARRRLLMNLMATSRVFAALDDAERLQMLKAFVSTVVEAGQVLIAEAQPGTGLYVVLEGEFEVSKIDSASDQVVLAYLRAGDVFGEISLLENTPATATVRAVEKSVVLHLPSSKFKDFVMAHPRLGGFLATLSAERKEEAEGAMEGEGVVLGPDDLILV